ncbi:ABC transporter permease [Pseudaminobacter soli (ex Li et al. 2025)]|nr:ABC transporter permease [Mesorhizobium soli]
MAVIGRTEDGVRSSPVASALVWLAGIAREYGSLVLVLICWELVARLSLVPPYLMPPFNEVLVRIWAEIGDGTLWVNLLDTLRRTLVGFGIAVVAGVAIGLLLARSSTAEWLVGPLVSIGFPLPKIVFLPIFILWFGVYDTSKVIMIVCDAIFPVITATVAGAQGVERQIIWSARNLGAGERDLLWTIILPAAAPQILSGIEVSLPIALIVAVITEMMLGGTGIGAAMMESWRFAESTGVFAGLLELSIIGFLLIRSMNALRRRLLRWHAEAQADLV